MDRIAGKNGQGTPDTGDTIEDPSELAKQVNAYIEKLEADLAEVDCKLLSIHLVLRLASWDYKMSTPL